MRLGDGARVAVIGAGPGGLTAAKHLLEAGLEPTVFEAGNDLGGQWHSAAPHSGIWPGMRTNTSRAMTAFSDFPAPPEHELHPLATQVHAYLRAYADHFGVTPLIRYGTRVERVEPGWRVDGEPFDAVVAASGRFRRPVVPDVVAPFAGELLHAFDYPGAGPFRDRRVLVYGNGVSGLEIASDLAGTTAVVAAFRKPRYVIPKRVGDTPSDWQWYTLAGALERRRLPRDVLSRLLRERVLRTAGDPAHFGAPAPDPDVLVAGLSLCQDFLAQVGRGQIACRPGIAAVEGRRVTFTDGRAETVDAIVCATGYALDLPYLSEAVWAATGPGFDLYHRTLHPDLPGFGAIGQFPLQGPFLPLLELQARWIAGVFTGVAPALDPARMRAVIAQGRPPIDLHHLLATTFAEEAGVAPDLLARPELTEALVFGPLLPPRYRLDGPGARPDAAARFAEQLASSPRPPEQPGDFDALRALGLPELSSPVPATTA